MKSYAVNSGRSVIRARGRPAKLSVAMIIDATMSLLDDRNVEDLSMAAVAEAVGVSSMALYKYFPNRDALLEAVAEHCFRLFEPPAITHDLCRDLLAWLWALQSHFDRYPIVSKVTGWEGRIPTAWLRITLPVIRLLKESGLQGGELALASEYFFSSALGLMLIEASAARFRPHLLLESLEPLDIESQKLLLDLQTHRSRVQREKILELGFRQIIDGLELQLPSAKAKLPAKRGR